MSIEEKIGVSLGPLLSMDDLLRCAKMADQQQNIDSLWIPESWGRESFSSLGAISQITKNIRLGTSIIGIYSRTPAITAMAATTLDMLSGNRTVIGLGASTPAIVENWHGVHFDMPARRMKEYIELVRLMTQGEKVNYSGKFFKINNFKMLHQPQRKHIPIFMAAVNKKMISIASDLADGILLYLRPFEELNKITYELKQATKGKAFEIACSFVSAVSNKEPQKARDRAAVTLAFYVAVGRYYSNFLAENGFKAEVQEIIEEYKKSGAEAAAKFVSDKMLNSLATGITLPVLQFNPIGDSESSFREMLSTF
jgi:5,10-methylenetetrahydromethanopterin reductase